MSERADVVVIGGGVMGASAALHLLEAGAGRVTLVERDGIAQGTTAAGAGFVAPWAAGYIATLGPEELAAERYGIAFYGELAADGHAIDHRANGLLSVAGDADALPALERLATAAADVERERCSPARVERLTAGAIAAEAIAGGGGVFLPEAVQVSAAKAAPAIAARFERAGGRVERRRPVTGLCVAGGRVTGVETTAGRIQCDVVVLAAGAWCRELLAPLGVALPMAPLVTSRLVTEPVGVPAELPMLFLYGLEAIDSIWLRGQDGALVYGGHYTCAPETLLLDAPLPERFDQLPLDGALAARRAGEQAARVLPALGRARSVTVAHGAPCFTPDMRSLVGPVPGFDGLHVVTGDNEAGVTHGPGYGRALAAHVVGDGALGELAAWRVDRFGDRYANEADVAAARAHAA
jgi:sarcosine oxidase subunit beta